VLVKRALFLLNAAFGVAILDLTSQVLQTKRARIKEERNEL